MSKAIERLEPRSRRDDFREGLEARIADPLWMLGRQWQLGELTATDGGHPVHAALSTHTTRMTHVDLGAGPIDVIGRSIETIVEAEPDTLDVRRAVHLGQQLERMLRASLPATDANVVISALRTAFAVEPTEPADRASTDRATQRWRAMFAGRVIDASALWAAVGLASKPVLPAKVTLSPARRAAAQGVIARWIGKSGIDRLRAEPSSPPAWKSDELAYRFGARLEDGTELHAPRYASGDLDWHTFDVVADRDDPGASDGAPRASTPVRVMFPGMPEPRFFAFESSRLSFPRVKLDKSNVLALALLDFALVYGNDWWQIPVEVPLGSLTRVRSLRVRDSFGASFDVPAAVDVAGDVASRFVLFQLADRGGQVVPGLLVPPLTGFRDESGPLEEVVFGRDEQDNRVWAEERRVLDGTGRPTSGALAHLEALRREAGALADLRAAEVAAMSATLRSALDEVDAALASPRGLSEEATIARATAAAAALHSATASLAAPGNAARTDAPGPRYLLARETRPEVVPYVPRTIAGTSQIALRRATALLAAGGVALARSRLLRGDAGTPWLREEVIAKTGVGLVVTRQRTRWVDGTTHTWVGRAESRGVPVRVGYETDVVEEE